VILRDLFSEDGGGYFQDAVLLDRLTLEKLVGVADEVRAEGWKWAQAFLDYPHAHGLRRAYPKQADLSPEDQERLNALQAQFDALSAEYEREDVLPSEVEADYNTLEAEIEHLSARRFAYDADAVARGGVFVILNHDGTARIERGFIRPEDEAPEPEMEADDEGAEAAAGEEPAGEDDDSEASGSDPEDDEAEDGKPLSDLLVRDLTAHRTLGLRLALGEQPDIALIAVTHTLIAQAFYRGHDSGACLDLTPTSTPLGGHADGIEDTQAAKALADRHALGRRRCRGTRASYGPSSWRWIMTAAWPCSPIAPP
jgi:ParB family chromosome partitioning protein